MGELVVDSLKIVVVKTGCATGKMLVKVVYTCEENLLSTFCCTKDESTVIIVLPLTNKEEVLREEHTGKLYSGNLIVCIDTGVFYDMSKLD